MVQQSWPPRPFSSPLDMGYKLSLACIGRPFEDRRVNTTLGSRFTNQYPHNILNKPRERFFHATGGATSIPKTLDNTHAKTLKIIAPNSFRPFAESLFAGSLFFLTTLFYGASPCRQCPTEKLGPCEKLPNRATVRGCRAVTYIGWYYMVVYFKNSHAGFLLHRGAIRAQLTSLVMSPRGGPGARQPENTESNTDCSITSADLACLRRYVPI